MSLSNIVFFYGPTIPDTCLDDFDLAVLDPGCRFEPLRQQHRRARPLTYLSAGEVLPAYPYSAHIPHSWLIGHNPVWNTKILDQSRPEWQDFFITHVATPPWQAGYRGFFLDTLDAYQWLTLSEADRRRQQQGLVRMITGLRAAFHDALIIMNRGFELLEAVSDHVDAVAFESLFQGWDQKAGRYVAIDAQDRSWLMARVRAAQTLDLPVIAMDYCPPDDPTLAAETRQRIRALGLIPHIADGHLLTVYKPPEPPANPQ